MAIIEPNDMLCATAFKMGFICLYAVMYVFLYCCPVNMFAHPCTSYNALCTCSFNNITLCMSLCICERFIYPATVSICSKRLDESVSQDPHALAAKPYVFGNMMHIIHTGIIRVFIWHISKSLVDKNNLMLCINSRACCDMLKQPM